jgi:hypothetical protein
MAVTAMIRSHLPEAYLKEDIGGELVYVLPPFSTKVAGAYLSLLRALDQGMGDLNIGCYGISDTTVEEVHENILSFILVFLLPIPLLSFTVLGIESSKALCMLDNHSTSGQYSQLHLFLKADITCCELRINMCTIF